MSGSSGRPIVVVGFGGMGHETCWIAGRCGIDVAGFLDDDPACAGKRYGAARVLGTVSDWRRYAECSFVIAVGDPAVRKTIRDAMISAGESGEHSTGGPAFATLIDPAAAVDPSHAAVGEGSVIGPNTTATTGVTIGAHCIVNGGAFIGHDVSVGDFCMIAALAGIGGNVALDPLVWVGQSASIRQGLRVGRGAVLGMGAVLTRSVPAGEVWAGNPAGPIRGGRKNAHA